MTDVHNQLKNAVDISLAIRRMFGGDSGLSVERLSETLQPIVNIWEHPECAWLRGEVLWSSAVSQAATAAELAFISVSNPSDSNLLITVRSMAVRATTANEQVAIGHAADSIPLANQDATQLGFSLDRRAPASSRAILRRGAYAATQISVLERCRIEVANAYIDVKHCLPVILIPGTALIAEHQTVNAGFDVNVAGSVRRVVGGELV